MPLLCSRFNRKYIMVLVLSIFTACSLASVFVTNFTGLLILRVMPSIFHPFYCALAFSVAAASVAPSESPKAVAKINMGVAGGMVLGVPISNFLASTVGLSGALLFFAIPSAIALLLTIKYVPSMPVTQAMSYGDQLRVLRHPSLWFAAFAIVAMNGSIYGVFNYWADFLEKVFLASVALSPILLAFFGICNVVGSYLSGTALSKSAKGTIAFFLCGTAGIYLLLQGFATYLPFLAFLMIIWGLLGGFNANINQF